LAAAQRFFPLEDGSGLVLTTAIFRPSSGEQLWSKGLTPDIELEGGSMESGPYLEATRKLIASR
jgi:carboxyl-terminal processing protease